MPKDVDARNKSGHDDRGAIPWRAAAGPALYWRHRGDAIPGPPQGVGDAIARSRRHRELHLCGPARFAGAAGLGMHAPFRRQPGVLRPAAPGRADRLLRDRARGFRVERAALSAQHRDRRDHAARQVRARAEDPGLRAALQAARPPRPPADPGAPADPGLRLPAYPHQAAARRELRRGAAGGHARQQSPALRPAGPCAQAHHQRVGFLRDRGNPVPAQPPARPHTRPRRRHRAGHRRAFPRVLRADGGLLAGMGALHRAALRVAERGDPGGHHPQACARSRRPAPSSPP